MKEMACASIKDCPIFLSFGYCIVFINTTSEIAILNHVLKVIAVVVFLHSKFLIFNALWLI